MEDERVVKLLEEIRDLQRQNVANYHEALRNQQEAIGIQRAATRRVTRLAMVILVLLFLLACWTLAWRRISPRLARYLCLSPAEMILVYLMVTVGTALAGECWAIHVVPGLAGTAAYQAATSHPEWASWLADPAGGICTRETLGGTSGTVTAMKILPCTASLTDSMVAACAE